jgi:hypothetical protein
LTRERETRHLAAITSPPSSVVAPPIHPTTKTRIVACWFGTPSSRRLLDRRQNAALRHFAGSDQRGGATRQIPTCLKINPSNSKGNCDHFSNRAQAEMTDRLARSPGSTHSSRTRAIEPITALEPVTIDGGRLGIEFRAGDRIERLEVRQFTPDWLVVEIHGERQFGHEPMATKLEIVGPSGFVEQFRCELEFAGWESVSGNLDGEQLRRARLLLSCERHERSELVRLYRQLRFPALFDRGEIDCDRLIELFQSSGSASVRPSRAWCAANYPAGLSVDAVYCSEDGALLGHVSVTRAYSRTWLGHQLTVLDDHPQSTAARIALYHHFATVPILIDAHQQQYLVSYYDRSRPWHQLFFESFVDWYDDRGKAGIVPFDRYEVIEAQGSTADDSALELDQVRPDELERAVALIREQLSPLACAAFDIDASLLDRAYLHPDFAAHGIARGRRVFVVREAGELVGVALCETGSEDLSLFNLFNLAQLYFRARASSAAQQALVNFVRCHYRGIGKPDPLLVAPAGSLAEPLEAGLELVETLGCVIWSGQTLRAYRTFLRTTFARICERAANNSEKPVRRLDAVYLPRLADARARVRDDARLQPLLSGALSPVELLGFLLHASALGMRMAEGAERQRRAGFACMAAGEEQLGAALCAAADREIERERLLLDDLFELGQRWRAQVGVRINVELLVHQPPPRSLLCFADFRDELASGPCPAALLALDLEIATLWQSLGAALLEVCHRTFDRNLRPGFMVEVSGASLEAPLAQLEHALAVEQAIAEFIAEVGRAGLDAYLDVLGDCVELGRELAERVRVSGAARAGRATATIRLAFA